MTDKITRKKILTYLYELYKKDPTDIKSTDDLAIALGISYLDAKGTLIYLHQRGLIDSFPDRFTDDWRQKINANGIDEIEKSASEVKPIKYDMDNKTIRINILEYLKYHYGKEFSGEPELHHLTLDLDLTKEDAAANLRYMEEKGWIESFAGQYDTAYQLTTKGMDALDRFNSKDSNVTPSKKLKSNLTNNKIKSTETTHAEILSKPHDFFICHATEDKEIVARPLAQKLDKLGLDVWYDEFSLRWGSKLMKTITKGIKESKFGIVILSPQFFEKKWAQLELDALVALLNLDDGELLPLLYNLTHEQAKERLPLLSGILYRSWDEGIDQLVMELRNITSGKISEFRKTNMVKTELVSKAKLHEFDLTLDKFTENVNHYVGIRNAKGITIKSCMVLCNGEKCAWWDTGDFLPRHIYEGGGGNVLLPRGFANTNPIIVVKSGDEVIEQVELSKIVHRPSSNWNAEDENTEFVDRLNLALGRIRSNLATMRSLFQMFVEHPKVPILPEMKINLSQKDELVENTQIVVNQASHVLDVSWMNDLNDLCSLAKKNPWFLPGSEILQIMQCESCYGVISQIDNLLKRLPNPPM